MCLGEWARSKRGTGSTHAELRMFSWLGRALPPVTDVRPLCSNEFNEHSCSISTGAPATEAVFNGYVRNRSCQAQSNIR